MRLLGHLRGLRDQAHLGLRRRGVRHRLPHHVAPLGLLRDGARRLPGGHRVAEPVGVVERQRGRLPVLPLLLDVGVLAHPRRMRLEQGHGLVGAARIAERAREGDREAQLEVAAAEIARRRDRLLAEAQRLVQFVARHRQLEAGVEREQALLVVGRRLLDRLDRGAGLRAEVVGGERAGPAQQRLEALGRQAGALVAARRLGEQAALLGERRGPARALGRRQEGRARRPPLAGLDPVLRQPRRLALALLQEGGDFGVELARHRRRHRGERRFVDQVVHEGAVAQHLRLLELGARVGEIEGAQAEHVRCELDREVGRGDRGAARQPHRIGRQV